MHRTRRIRRSPTRPTGPSGTAEPRPSQPTRPAAYRARRPGRAGLAGRFIQGLADLLPRTVQLCIHCRQKPSRVLGQPHRKPDRAPTVAPVPLPRARPRALWHDPLRKLEQGDHTPKQRQTLGHASPQRHSPGQNEPPALAINEANNPDTTLQPIPSHPSDPAAIKTPGLPDQDYLRTAVRTADPLGRRPDSATICVEGPALSLRRS